MISRFAKNLSFEYFNAINQILQYLARSCVSDITFGGEKELKLVGYSDSDWAGDYAGQKSTSSFVFLLSGGFISYMSKKQLVVTLSSTKAKYVALSLATQLVTWLLLLLTVLKLLTLSEQFAKIYIYKKNKYVKLIFPISEEFHKLNKHILKKTTMPNIKKISISNETILEEIFITLEGDNHSSISLANNPILYTQTIYIDIQYYYIRNNVISEIINLIYIPKKEMLADGLTKSLSHVKFLNFIKQMRMK